MSALTEISALILAGGRATRLGGIAKHEIMVDGRSILLRQVDVLAPRVVEIFVSSPTPVAGYRTVEDLVPDGGPLAGIAAGIAAVTTEWMLVVAGDMPDLSPAVIDLMIERRGGDAVAFQIGGLPEPLLCALRREPAGRAVAELLARGERKASRLLTDAGLNVVWVSERELRDVDPTLRSLRNINEPADL